MRDGRDVACSYKELNNKKIESIYTPKLKNSTKDIALEWSNNVLSIKNTLTSLNANSLTIKYEALINNTIEVIRSICYFLEVEYSEQMLYYYKNKKDHEPVNFLQWKEKTLLAPTNQSIGRYQHDLSKNELKVFNTYAMKGLIEFEYIFF